MRDADAYAVIQSWYRVCVASQASTCSTSTSTWDDIIIIGANVERKLWKQWSNDD